jgi:hypothetical protein
MNDHLLALAKKIWDYHHLNQPLAEADAILVLCSHDKAVAERGATVYLGLGAATYLLWRTGHAHQDYVDRA